MLRALVIGLICGNVVVYGALAQLWLEFRPHGTTTLYKMESTSKSPVRRSVVTDAAWRPVPQWI